MEKFRKKVNSLLRRLLGKYSCRLTGGHPTDMITKWECLKIQPMSGDYDKNPLVWKRECLQCGEKIHWEFCGDPNK